MTSSFETCLTVFLTRVLGLLSYYSSYEGHTDTEEVAENSADQSDIFRPSLVLLSLATAVIAMSYVVLVTAYVVIHFT